MLESYVRQLIKTSLAAGMAEVTFAWQGSEPTILGVNYFRQIVSLQEKYAPKGVLNTNAPQTNGILLNDEWGQFLKENGFLSGISIDESKKIHDRYRLDRGPDARPSMR